MPQFNIPYLDPNPQLCAYAYIDSHVKSMCIDVALLLSHFRRRYEGDEVNNVMGVYQSVGPNNYTDWLAESVANYTWMYDLFVFLCLEHRSRFDKPHVAEEVLTALKSYPNMPTNRLAKIVGINKFSPPPANVPKKFWLDDNKKPWAPPVTRRIGQPEGRQRSQLNTCRAWYKATYVVRAKYTKAMQPQPAWLMEGLEHVEGADVREAR